MPPEPSSSVLVGRGREPGIIRSILDRSAAEDAQTLLVSGDAGVGKTALVTRACSDDVRSLTIFGACLPLTSMSIPLLPIRSALRDLDEELEHAGIGDLDGEGRDVTARPARSTRSTVPRRARPTCGRPRWRPAPTGDSPGRRRTRAGARPWRSSVAGTIGGQERRCSATDSRLRSASRPGRSRRSCATWRGGHGSASTSRHPRHPVRPDAIHGLTEREREVLDLIAVGRTSSEIARTLMISEKTVSAHVSHLLAKTGTANRVELARLVHRIADDRDPTG